MTAANGLGSRIWVLPGGRIPFPSHGNEPEFTSADELCVLNTGDEAAELELTIYYADQDPVGPYHVSVDARRVRHVRFNDLVDPEAIRLGRPFGCVAESQIPVVVQLNRQDTRVSGALAVATAMAFPQPPQ